jgi:glutamine synthetase
MTEFQSAITGLERALAHHAEGDLLAHATYSRDAILPAMATVRSYGDKLETSIADDLWPLPTYREMLFIK